jgi:predicted DsbA family dithiol-disulfide isomerase
LKNFAVIAGWVFSATVLVVACKNSVPHSQLAEVDGQAISSTDLDKAGGKELFRQREALYKTEQKKLDDYIGAILLTKEAKRRGISVASLLDQEINSKVAPVTDDEVAAFYESHKDRLAVELAKVSDQIREHLRDQRVETQTALYVRSLRSNAKIVTYLKSPPVFRADVSANGAPFRGAEKARVTIVKFEDFLCPYCKTAQPTFFELLTRYDGKVKLVHKDLPLDAIHPQARQAAEAARCAGEQEMFWQYHDKLYSHSPKLAVEELKGLAKELGLNGGAFEKCLTSGKFKSAVQKDLLEAAQLGLTGTPAFFINGREITGAQPIEAFAALIDDELALAK